MSGSITVEKISKWYRKYHAGRPETLKEALLSGLRRMQPAEQFWALQEVSFTVPSGRMLGVVGANGAGKSTLLRLVGGVGFPDRGSIRVQGRIGALLDLGAGFHPDLTGRENVFINGIISGLTRREVAERLDEIIAFSELEAFIDNPLRTYSTGMQMRLAFAVAAHIDPEVLLVDEVLAVGDLAFQRKCLDRIAQFKRSGCTILLVSHDTSTIKNLCDEALWLRRGQVAAHGPTEVVVGAYVAEMSAETRRRTPEAQPAILTPSGTELRMNQNRFGSQEISLNEVRLLSKHGFAVKELESGEALRVEIDYTASQPVSEPIFGVAITRPDDLVCYDSSNQTALKLGVLQGQGQVAVTFERLDLIGGPYFIDVGVYEREWTYAYDYHWHVYPLEIAHTRGEKGVARPPTRWEIKSL